MKKGKFVLFGAGAAGTYALKHLRGRGEDVVAFADTDKNKQGKEIDGITVMDPTLCLLKYPKAKWVATAISRPASREIREQIKQLKVATVPLWECLPVCHGLPPNGACGTVENLIGDKLSEKEWFDQLNFRLHPDYDRQRDPVPCSDIYFPDFIRKIDDEHFVDCGACDGDTVKLFLSRWNTWKHITAFEPDQNNYQKLKELVGSSLDIDVFQSAVSDHGGSISFVSNSDYSSHVGVSGERVPCMKMNGFFSDPPTYIKMDIEGSELEAIWGSRRILKEYKPVLAICAYHTSDHLWEIPLLIHAIQPEYKLFLRRYAEGAFELVWYGVPPERLK